jgi:peptidoglycan/LPS O-acetylase OafA/YrhL
MSIPTNASDSAADQPSDSVLHNLNQPEASAQKSIGVGDNFAATGYVRFLLAFVVIVSHDKWYTQFWIPFIDVWPDAQAAVCGFFVLSGWVIGASVVRGDTKSFYLRRIERLLPVYLICATWAQMPWHFIGHKFGLPGGTNMFQMPLGRRYIAANFLFLQGWVNGSEITFAPAWSMSCEVFYYLLAPLFKKATTRALIAVAAASLIFYLLHALFLAPDVAANSFGLPSLMMAWAWLAGFVAFRWHKTRPFLATVLLLSVGTFWLNGSCYLVLLAALAILYGHKIPFSKFANKLGIFLGDLSYPLYLSHLTTFIFVAHYLPESFHRRTILSLLAALLFATAILVLVDRPLQALFKRRRIPVTA